MTMKKTIASVAASLVAISAVATTMASAATTTQAASTKTFNVTTGSYENTYTKSIVIRGDYKQAALAGSITLESNVKLDDLELVVEGYYDTANGTIDKKDTLDFDEIGTDAAGTKDKLWKLSEKNGTGSEDDLIAADYTEITKVTLNIKSVDDSFNTKGAAEDDDVENIDFVLTPVDDLVYTAPAAVETTLGDIFAELGLLEDATDDAGAPITTTTYAADTLTVESDDAVTAASDADGVDFVADIYEKYDDDNNTATLRDDYDYEDGIELDAFKENLTYGVASTIGGTKGATVKFTFSSAEDTDNDDIDLADILSDSVDEFGIMINNTGKLIETGSITDDSISFKWDDIVAGSGLSINSTGLVDSIKVAAGGLDSGDELILESVTVDIPAKTFEDLSAGEPATDTAAAITAAPATTTAAAAVTVAATTAAATNPTTGNAPIALAVIPVAIAAAAIIAKKRG